MHGRVREQWIPTDMSDSPSRDARHTTYESLVLALERLLTDLPATTCCVVLGELERLKALTVMKLVALPQGSPEVKTMEVRYLTVDQVCKRYGVKPRWRGRNTTVTQAWATMECMQASDARLLGRVLNL